MTPLALRGEAVWIPDVLGDDSVWRGQARTQRPYPPPALCQFPFPYSPFPHSPPPHSPARLLHSPCRSRLASATLGSPPSRPPDARVLPPPLPHAILAAGRGRSDRQARWPRGRAGTPGRRDHRPRESVRRPRVLYEGEKGRRPAHHRVRVLRHGLGHGRQDRPRAVPPGPAGEDAGGVQEPHPALVAELHRRVLLQAPDRPRHAPPARRRARRDDVLLAGRGAADDPQKGRGRSAQSLRGLPRHLRRRLLRRGPGPRHPRPADLQRRPHALGRRVRRHRRRLERRPLRPSAGRRGPGRPPVPPDREGPPRPEPDAVRERPVLPQIRRRDAARVRVERARGRLPRRGRRRRRDRRLRRGRRQVPARAADGRAAHAALPHPARVLRPGRLPPPPQLPGRPEAVARDHRERFGSGWTWSWA